MSVSYITTSLTEITPGESLGANMPGYREVWIQTLGLAITYTESLNRFAMPAAKGITAVYIYLYRTWLDKYHPDHHLTLIHRNTRGRHETYVRLTVKCKALNIKIEDEFLYRDADSLDRAKTLARSRREQLPDGLFCLVRRPEPEVPGIYHYPKQQCYKADISTGEKRHYKAFSYRFCPASEAYNRAVKALFDTRLVEYPERLFPDYGFPLN